MKQQSRLIPLKTSRYDPYAFDRVIPNPLEWPKNEKMTMDSKCSVPAQDQRRVCIGAIMKQEGRYLLEWVAWHKFLGFELIVADNGGTDNQSDLLWRLQDAGMVTRLDVRRFTDRPQRKYSSICG